MGKPFFSIIVPVYNAVDTIGKCVDSIQTQSFPDWQLILVNDGSSDNSGKVCRQMAEKDSRILAIDKDNGGPSSARNVGMNVANGEWILFVDSDDYISPKTLAHYCDKIETDSDLIIPDTMIEYPGGRQIRIAHSEAKIPRSQFESLFSDFCLGQRTSIGGKCFRASIIRDNRLRFNEEMRHAEDLVWIYDYLRFCRKVGFTGQPDYIYVFGNPESLTQKFYSFEKEYQGYVKVRDSVGRAIREFHISRQEALDSMSQPVITSIKRTLNAIYHTELNSSGKERRAMIRKLDLQFFKDHAPYSYNKKLRFLNFILLRLRAVWLYDCIRGIKAKHR